MNQRFGDAYRIVLVMTLLMGLAFSIQTGRAQERPTEAPIFLKHWLFLNCGVGEGDSIQDSLVTWGKVLEPFLIESFRRGPDSVDLKEAETAANRRFLERKRLLEEKVDFGLSPEDLAAARGISHETYMENQKSDFILRYKSQALSGLGFVGGVEARKLLQNVSSDKESPLQAVAQEALDKLDR